MGDFRIEINATGGHGCQREKKDGEKVENVNHAGCPDCMAREFVQKLKDAGMLSFPNNSTTLTHWPGQKDEVKDDLLTGIRKGSF